MDIKFFIKNSVDKTEKEVLSLDITEFDGIEQLQDSVKVFYSNGKSVDLKIPKDFTLIMRTSQKDDLTGVINSLLKYLQRTENSFCLIRGDEDHFGVFLRGDMSNIISSIAALMEKGKNNEFPGHSEPQTLYEMIMDAITVTFRPDEINYQMNNRIDKMINHVK